MSERLYSMHKNREKIKIQCKVCKFFQMWYSVEIAQVSGWTIGNTFEECVCSCCKDDQK